MFKKLTAVLLAAALLTAFTGCDDEKNNDDISDAESQVSVNDTADGDESAAENTVEETKKEVKTEKVKVYKELFSLDFASMPDGPAPFSGNAVPDLRIENGVMTANSVSGDPYFHYDGQFSLNASEADTIVIKLMNYTSNNSFQLFFTTPETGWSEGASFKDTLKHNVDDGTENDWNYVIINTQENAYWDDTITCFRVDPFSSEGEFAISFIAFYQTTTLEVPVEE